MLFLMSRGKIQRKMPPRGQRWLTARTAVWESIVLLNTPANIKKNPVSVTLHLTVEAGSRGIPYIIFVASVLHLILRNLCQWFASSHSASRNCSVHGGPFSYALIFWKLSYTFLGHSSVRDHICSVLLEPLSPNFLGIYFFDTAFFSEKPLPKAICYGLSPCLSTGHFPLSFFHGQYRLFFIAKFDALYKLYLPNKSEGYSLTYDPRNDMNETKRKAVEHTNKL